MDEMNQKMLHQMFQHSVEQEELLQEKEDDELLMLQKKLAKAHKKLMKKGKCYPYIYISVFMYVYVYMFDKLMIKSTLFGCLLVLDTLENEIQALSKQMTSQMEEFRLTQEQTSSMEDEDKEIQKIQKRLTRAQKKLIKKGEL